MYFMVMNCAWVLYLVHGFLVLQLAHLSAQKLNIILNIRLVFLLLL